MDRIAAMQLFSEVADRNSLTEAAGALSISRAMASRQLESLERWLGVRLFHRTTRRVSLTEAGAEALQRCRRVLELAQEVQAMASTHRGEAVGKLRLTASPSFAQTHLASAFAEFLERHPQTRVELIATEHAVNLVEERIDLAIRITNDVDDSLVARRLGTCQSVICASPEYVATHGLPRRPEDLSRHRCILHSSVGRNEYRLEHGGRVHRVPVAGVLQVNSTTVTRAATLAGAGVCQLPTFLVGDDLRSGRLVRLLPQFVPEQLGIYALYLSRKHQPLLLRLMLDFLVERFGGAVAPWDQGLEATPPVKRGARKGSTATAARPRSKGGSG